MDMVTMNIIDSTMVSICREMGITMMKTSYSTIFNEGLDFTCGLGNTRGRPDRGRRVQPLADRRPAARPADLCPGNPPRRGRGRRRHRPQRPLSGRHAHAPSTPSSSPCSTGASSWATPSPSATWRRWAAWCPAASPARPPRSSTRACASPRSRSRSAART